jgi:hypothetical protein
MTDESPATVHEGPPSHEATARQGWEPLPHEPLPRPNFFPAGLAMGTTFIFWGLITSWVIIAVGIALFAAALAGWIYEILRERNHR